MHAASNELESTALRTLLRSLGQIVLQPNAVTGACLLAAWLACDPRLACAALTGAVSANVAAVLAGYDEADTRDGLHGFNGALAGLAAFTFIGDGATAAAVAILAGMATAWGLGPWSRWLRTRGLAVYSSPCLIVTWLWLPLFTPRAATTTPLQLASFSHLTDGVLSGLAQTDFASGAVPGLLVLAGISASSLRHAAWALAGAGIASALHLLLGAGLPSFGAGLLGFNGALTALALAECGWIATLGGILLSVVLQQIAGRYGLPVMTAPFVAATWSVQSLRRRRRINPPSATGKPALRRSAQSLARTS
ncbi:urea transporter [Paraburkholderia phenazinium]|jgi:urea transporter|uniref:Urea transporter n=1 Tax=Paraburkholderia phenazinium TaxID=60549 RepID=A0A1G8G655_9BURK|nr:urea transporter [Paraburkholderia phenazinium]SDH89761.1 urea transporter [Paraburkholderia phenazinium]